MLIRLYVIGHLKEMLTADEGSDRFIEPDEEWGMLETVPVPQISDGDDFMGSELTSMLDVCCSVVELVLLSLVVKELKIFLT